MIPRYIQALRPEDQGKNMLESEFHRRADETLNRIEETLESAEPQGVECDRMGPALTVTLPSGRQIVVNKHTPTQELWLASPVSGGLHFTWDNGAGWTLKDGRKLG